MSTSKKRVELLAPAGNFEKLETAIHYGADAVYLSGKDFSLRNFSGNFSVEEIEAAVGYAHERGVRVYVACNTYSRNREQAALTRYLHQLAAIGPDAVIVADPAVLMAVRKMMPSTPVHISTQANTTNYAAARFWGDHGAERIIAARELTLLEIGEIASRREVAVEAFIHGAMCISYSGRCLLSSYLALRDSNRGRCAHPCRWNYALVEEKRPGQYLPLREDEHGTYIFNSRDLCMIEHIPALIESGIAALKIEGRMKGIHYVAVTVKAYREAIDAYYRRPQDYRIARDWWAALESVNQRGYCTGFYFGDPSQTSPNLELQQPSYAHRLVGRIVSAEGDGTFIVDVRNRLSTGDRIEVLSPGRHIQSDTLRDMTDLDGLRLPVAHAGRRVRLALRVPGGSMDIIRRRDPSNTAPAPTTVEDRRD